MNRSTSILSALLMALSCLVGISPVTAQVGTQNLPSSSNPATGKWTRMTPSSFPGTVSSAKEQCLRDVAADLTGQVTLQKCDLLEVMLKNGQCSVVMVPDGMRHDIMNSRTNGRSGITHNVEKQLDRLDRAILCDLTGGVHAYWYTGVLRVSCNNVAFSFVTPPPPLPPIAMVPPKPNCHYVTRTRQTQSTGGIFLSSVYLPGCGECCRPLYVGPHNIAPTGGDNITETVLVCN